MVLNTKQLKKPSQSIIILKSTLPGVHAVYIFKAEDFYVRYYGTGEPGGARRIHEDIVDTYMRSEENTWGYNTETLMESTTIEIINDMNAFYIEL